MAKLTENKIGVLAYAVHVDGEQVAHIDENDPVEYFHGGGNIVPGLEKALEGKEAGDTFDVTVPPEEAYGEYDDDNMIEVLKADFGYEDMKEDLEVGTEVELMDEDDEILEGVIHEIGDEVVVVDLNPPHAGKTIRYVGKVMDVRDATEEEIEWGFPESLLDELYGVDEWEEDEL
jgi:FKBP-type peptidyl-prolyl cis-trans isomerase SlyD